MEFVANGHRYVLVLLKLNNVLVGDDTARFRLSAPEDAVETLTEEEKIEKLIASLSELEGAGFIRNGKEHTVEEGIEHIRMKLEWKKEEIKTAGDFIRIAGTESSSTGEP